MNRLPAPLQWLLALALLAGLIWVVTTNPDSRYRSYYPGYHTSRPAPAVHRPSLWQQITSHHGTSPAKTTRTRGRR